MAQLRLLIENGLPGILLDLDAEGLWMAAACEGNFMGTCRPREHIHDMSGQLEYYVGITNSQEMPEPAYVLTNLSHRFTPASG